jgi:hypothetical protein
LLEPLQLHLLLKLSERRLEVFGNRFHQPKPKPTVKPPKPKGLAAQRLKDIKQAKDMLAHGDLAGYHRLMGIAEHRGEQLASWCRQKRKSIEAEQLRAN